tara:strand:- start:21 stop:239 length:219 start_codon:yes stop_codon:yes gene_type:complete
VKPGDLVRLNRKKNLYTISEWNSVGVIVEALTSGIARKHNSYLVMWPEALENSKNIPHKNEWYSAPSIEKVD